MNDCLPEMSQTTSVLPVDLSCPELVRSGLIKGDTGPYGTWQVTSTLGEYLAKRF